MRRIPPTFLGAGLMAAMAATASAATISLTDTSGDPLSIAGLAPGSLFQVQTSLALDPGEDAIGVSFRLSASDSGLFTIVDRTVEAGNPYTELLTANPAAPANSPTLNPSNGADLGGFAPDFLPPGDPGPYLLYTFTLQLSPTAPVGVYQLQASGVQLSDPAFDTFFGDSTIYSISVPEPTSLGVATVAIGGLLLRRRPRRVR